MVSEAEILTSFLLERITFDQVFTLEKLERLFPSDVSDAAIEETFRLLSRRFQKRLDSVNKVIQAVGTEEGRSENSEKDTLREDRATNVPLTDLLSKMDAISSLLSKETDILETQVQQEQDNLENLIGDLKDVVLPRSEESQKETISDVIELLAAMESLQQDA